MRIGVSGPGGTGKSTLVRALAAELHYRVIDEGISDWLREHDGPGPWSLDAEQQLRMQEYAVAYKIKHEVGPAFISDRTTVDAVSLMTLRLPRLGRTIPTALRETALAHARQTYELVVLFGPHRVTAEVDKVALLDETLRAREHELTRELYRELGTPMIHVPALSAAEIEPFVLGELRKRLGTYCGTIGMPIAAAMTSDERVAICLRLLPPLAAGRLRPDANAIFLWGSILSSDFDPDRSDVDLLTVSASPDAAAIGAFRDDARGAHPLFRNLDVTVAPAASRPTDARVKPFDRIDPLVVCSQIPALPFVWGNRDLAVRANVPPSELLRLRLRSLRRRLRFHDQNAADEPLPFVMKEMGFICHLMHEARVGAHPFSYEALRRHANAETRDAVELLIQNRNGDAAGIERDRVFAVATALEAAARDRRR